jgi:hypothetical protein
MIATKEQIEAAREIGATHAEEACRESLSTETPDGGWDSWLINAGTSEAASCLGLESLYDDNGDLSEIASELLCAYHAGAVEAAEELDLSEELQAAADLREMESQAMAELAAEANRLHLEEIAS